MDLKSKHVHGVSSVGPVKIASRAKLCTAKHYILGLCIKSMGLSYVEVALTQPQLTKVDVGAMLENKLSTWTSSRYMQQH